VIECHRTLDSHLGPSVQRNDAQEKFYSLHQKLSQPIEDYYEEFLDCVRNLDHVKIDKPSPADQAIRFLRGLNPSPTASWFR
jgi:hypothetical protein